MTSSPMLRVALALSLVVAPAPVAVYANAYREKGKVVRIKDSALSVTPPRDWNQLGVKPGKFAETWTLDGEQLNDVTFYAGVEPGQPIVRERNRKRDPLPKFQASTLLIEVPELLERTYRAQRQIGTFTVTASRPQPFLGKDGVVFAYDYLDSDDLPRKGEAVAAIVNGRLFMVTFDAPRLHFFDRKVDDYRALVASATLSGGK
ncbi:hypothetical protein [Sphingomonas adhaesiva]|uniref:hypothetical protein n=1 Tax=Sphingomonas adhaesiva TaxID=28212 RepID=UPI002FF8E085